MNWMNLLYIIGAGLLLWWAIHFIRTNPGAFTKEKMSKSITTLGFLALMLIAVVAFCVFTLKY